MPRVGTFEARTLEALRAAASDAEDAMWAAACTAASEYARNTGQSVANLVSLSLCAAAAYSFEISKVPPAPQHQHTPVLHHLHFVSQRLVLRRQM